MQQSSATQSLHLCFWGLRKIVACSHSSSQCLLVSTVFGTVSSLHPTSFLYLLYYSPAEAVAVKVQTAATLVMRTILSMPCYGLKCESILLTFNDVINAYS